MAEMNRLRLLMMIVAWSFISSAQAVDLTTPAGLNPGDSFRFVFVTSGTIAGTSSDIATYNTFINQQASGTTYQGSGITWYAIGSTTSIDARVNVGGFGTDVPVYLVTGTKVADDLTTGAGGIWSGNLLSGINRDSVGNSVVESRVWSGSTEFGTKNSTFELGSSLVRFGVSGYTDPFWISVNRDSNTSTYRIYGMSQTLTVVPEPSTIVTGMVAAAFVSGLSIRRSFRIRRKSRQS
jgi:hypothetical protein